MSAAKYLSTKHLMQAFAVSHMSIYAWRLGTATKDPLPTLLLGQDQRSVAFSPSKVKAWAKKHGVEVVDAAALDPAYEVVSTKPVKATVKPKKAPVKRNALAPTHRSHKANKPPPRKAEAPTAVAA